MFVNHTFSDIVYFALQILFDCCVAWFEGFSNTWKMVLKSLFVSDTGEDSALHINCSGLQGDGGHKVPMIASLGRWSWKGHFLVTQGKTVLCTFIFSGFQVDRALRVDMLV